MLSRTAVATAPNGATLEIATVTLDGREFSACGAMVDTANGIVCAYVSGEKGAYKLTTWDGTLLAPARLVSTHVNRRCFGGHPVTIYAWSVVYQGRTYSGRNAGPGMFLRLRAR